MNVIDCNGRSALSLLLEKLSGDWELCESMSWAHLACLMSTPITLNLRDLDVRVLCDSCLLLVIFLLRLNRKQELL